MIFFSNFYVARAKKIYEKTAKKSKTFKAQTQTFHYAESLREIQREIFLFSVFLSLIGRIAFKKKKNNKNKKIF